ncbi:MAG: hypothetical protein MUE46_14170 [Xanthomonadales bacterium]|jgi:hypothetical protein|nr:hypothetical protein [Xanthomonadales bacterium]
MPLPVVRTSSLGDLADHAAGVAPRGTAHLRVAAGASVIDACARSTLALNGDRRVFILRSPTRQSASRRYSAAREEHDGMDPKTLRAEARAAQTSDARLLELLSIDPALSRHIVARASLSDAMYGHLLQLGSIPTLRLMATLGHTPSSVQMQLAQHQNLNVVKALATNPALPGAALQRLARHPKPTVREVIAARVGLTPEIRAALLADPVAAVRTAMLSNPDISAAELDALLEDPSAEVRARLACMKTRYAHGLLHDAHPAVLANAIRHADLGEVRPHFARLMSRPEQGVRLACLIRLDDPLLLEAAARVENNVELQRWIARNLFTPEAALARLADVDDEQVQEALAGNPFASATTLHALAQKIRISRDNQRIADALIENPTTTPETLSLLVKRGYTIYNNANAWGSTPNWPAEFVVWLASTYYRYVGADEPREVLADQQHFDRIANTQPAIEVLRFMATSHLYYHVDAAVGNRNTPAEAIAEFYLKRNPVEHNYTIEDMARNPATPTAILRELIPTHARYLLKNPLLPDSILNALPADARSAGYWTADQLRRARQLRGISVDDSGVRSGVIAPSVPHSDCSITVSDAKR